jgi:hypothetical protein
MGLEDKVSQCNLEDFMNQQSVHLVIVSRNPQPERQYGRPQEWLLYASGRPAAKLHVEHLPGRKPVIIDKSAA